VAERILEKVDNEETVDIIFLDLQKAFAKYLNGDRYTNCMKLVFEARY
jgi:hypothetical protein